MENPGKQDVDRFITEEIDSVPHLEALLLVWRRRPRTWLADDMAQMLYVPRQNAERLLQDLAQRGLVAMTPGEPARYAYESVSSEEDRLLEAIDVTYRRELVRISNMIHSKAPAAVREFARAFRFTRDGK
jgi:DNA-binding MarR family transcriptional regulator